MKNLTVIGQVQILTRRSNNKLNLEIDNIDIVSADTRNRSEKPLKYCVVVHQGALTVYNYSSDPESIINANIKNITLGREKAPVITYGTSAIGFVNCGTVHKFVMNKKIL